VEERLHRIVLDAQRKYARPRHIRLDHRVRQFFNGTVAPPRELANLVPGKYGTFRYWTVSVAGFELSNSWWDVAPFE